MCLTNTDFVYNKSFTLQIIDYEPCEQGGVPKLSVIHIMSRTDKIEDAYKFLQQMKCTNSSKSLVNAKYHTLFGIKSNW